MIETPTEKIACKECGRETSYYEGPGDESPIVLQEGLCVMCSPVTMTCQQGKRCQWDCVVTVTGRNAHLLDRLTLCAAHKKRLKELRKRVAA